MVAEVLIVNERLFAGPFRCLNATLAKTKCLVTVPGRGRTLYPVETAANIWVELED